MKTRNIPFGYRMENGKIIFHPTESQAVQDIFSDYLDGQSLLKIAQRLNERQVEYLPGTTGWNKARLKRIIEDKRYIGSDGYPSIIEPSIYEKAQAVRASRNTQKSLDRTADIFKLQLPVLCEKCGEPMQRKHDSRTTYQEKWVCKSCDEVIKISDDAFLSAITECINYLIAKPNILQGDPTPTEPPVEVIRLKNEIGRMLDSPAIEKEPLKNRIFEYASLVYETFDRMTVFWTVFCGLFKILSSVFISCLEQKSIQLQIELEFSYSIFGEVCPRYRTRCIRQRMLRVLLLCDTHCGIPVLF